MELPISQLPILQDIWAVSTDDTLTDVSAILAREPDSCVLVLSSGTLAGIATYADVVRAIGRRLDPDRTKISEIMYKAPRWLDICDTVGNAQLVMADEGVNAVPICDGGSLIAVLTPRHIPIAYRYLFQSWMDWVSVDGAYQPLRCTV